MRGCIIFACVAGLTCLALSQQPSVPAKAGENKLTGSGDTALENLFQSKLKAEWEAIKNKDKKTFGEFLADEYQGIEVDGQGERNKLQAINELAGENVSNYTLWGLKVIPLGPDTTFVIYESTIQFPPGAQIRFSRVYIGSLWIKQAGQWKELHYQETRVK